MPRKTVTTTALALRPDGFNEAAARCRGKPTITAYLGSARLASMRPRPDAAENALLAEVVSAVTALQ